MIFEFKTETTRNRYNPGHGKLTFEFLFQGSDRSLFLVCLTVSITLTPKLKSHREGIKVAL